MSKDCKKARVLRKDCKKTEETTVKQCSAVSFCAGNQAIHFDGQCLTAEPRSYQIPDGTYSTVTFQDGCIVGVGQVALPTYTPSSCCGSASDPNTDLEPSDEPVAQVAISDDPNNLLTQTAGGLLVEPIFRGNGVQVTGTGTSSDPFVITANTSTQSAGIVSVTPESLEVGVDSYTQATSIGLKTQISSGTYGSFSVNDYGQITGYTASDAEPVTDIKNSSSGIFSISRTAGLVLLGLDDSKLTDLVTKKISELLPSLLTKYNRS